MASDKQSPETPSEDIQTLLRQLEQGPPRGRIDAAWQLCLLAEDNPELATDLARAVRDRGGTASSLVYQWLQSRYTLELDSGPGTGTDADWELTDPRVGDAEASQYPADRVIVEEQFTPRSSQVSEPTVMRSITQEGHVRTYAGMATIDGTEQAVFIRTYVSPESISDRDFARQCRSGFRDWQEVGMHPHIMQIYEYGLEPHPWSVLEYATETLASVGQMPPEVGLRVLRNVAAGVATAHQRGVTHLTLTPQMIAIDRRGPEPIPRIIGFGMQKVIETYRGQPVVDPQFAAPEHTGDGTLDWTTDIYLLGGVLYAALTGHPPFDGPPGSGRTLTPPSVAVGSLPPAVDPILEKTLAASKLDRYEAVDELIRDLQQLLES